jgi:hypothetical protein
LGNDENAKKILWIFCHDPMALHPKRWVSLLQALAQKYPSYVHWTKAIRKNIISSSLRNFFLTQRKAEGAKAQRKNQNFFLSFLGVS